MEGRVNSNPQTDVGQFQIVNGDLYIPSIPLGSINDYYLVINPDSKQVKYISLFGTSSITSSWAISSSQALTASYINASNIAGLNLSRISTGSITASVDVGTDTFKVQSGLSTFFTINSTGLVGIGVDNPTAKFQVAGSTLISGSSTFSGSLSQQSIFTASFGYLIANSSLINGNSVISGSIYIIQKASIGTTHQSASLTISASSAENAVLVKINDTNVTDKFKVNNEGIIVLGKLNNTPTAVEGGIFFSSSNDYFLGFS